MKRFLPIAGLFLLFALLPLLQVDARNYWLQVLSLLAMNIVLAQSYDIVGGRLGYINLGHITFFGLGAYALGIFYNLGLPLAPALAVAVAIVVGFAGAISYPFFRLRGAYFSLAAFGLVKLVEHIVINLGWLTGGSNGLKIEPADRTVPMYFLSLGAVAAVMAVSWWIGRSQLGLAMKSIAEDEDVARDFGVPTYRVKAQALMISAAFPAAMGGLYTWNINFIDPGQVFGLKIALTPIAMALLGGSGLLVGPLLGATFFYGIEEIIWTQLEHLHTAVLGLVIVLVGLFMPGGLARLRLVSGALAWLGWLEEEG